MFDIDRLRQGLDAKAKMTNESINKIANKMSSNGSAKLWEHSRIWRSMCFFYVVLMQVYIAGQNLLLDGELFESSF